MVAFYLQNQPKIGKHLQIAPSCPVSWLKNISNTTKAIWTYDGVHEIEKFSTSKSEIWENCVYSRLILEGDIPESIMTGLVIFREHGILALFKIIGISLKFSDSPKLG